MHEGWEDARKLILFIRHGEGYHNARQTQVGAEEWRRANACTGTSTGTEGVLARVS